MDTNQQILVEQRVANDSKNIVLAYLLLLFLWPFGAHRFYLGQTGSAIIMLILSLTVIGLIVTGIWSLIDLFLIPGYVDKNKQELRHRYTLEVMASSTGSANRAESAPSTFSEPPAPAAPVQPATPAAAELSDEAEEKPSKTDESKTPDKYA